MLEIIYNQPSMALMRLMLTAQQATFINNFRLYVFFNISLRHKVEEFILVLLPRNLFLLVWRQNFFCRSQLRNMDVINVT
ncbi:hypothetical protein MD26_15005 [Pseudomonas sp. H2]|nr:hypothetical protein MD26_15005 [Pseudomonas sp. H2]